MEDRGSQLSGTSLKVLLAESTFWFDLEQSWNKTQDENEEVDRTSLESSKNVYQVFKRLSDIVQPWICDQESTSYQNNLLIIKACLLLKKSTNADQIITKFYEDSFKAFKVFNKELFNFSDENEEEDDNDNDDSFSEESAQIILRNINLFNEILFQLDLVEEMANPAIVTLIYQQLTGFLEKHCKSEYSENWLQRVFTWMDKGLMSWLKFVNSKFSILDSHGMICDQADEINTFSIESWKQRLEYFVYKAFAELRISEMFEIIVEYPDSLPAIKDLQECLSKTESRRLLTSSLKSAFERRLLHPAVNTDDILTQYVSTIRSLRELDPSGIILENVCSPLREYLRSRDDTIKCIITCLTDQGSGPDLSEELLGFGDDFDTTKSCDVESDGEEWYPDPVDAVTSDAQTKSQRRADILNILVNIYGSQDTFVSQYRILLADRILNNYSYDVTNERRYIELLKRRFGENHMHYCDIMLKDIQDSHRINRRITTEMKKKQEGGEQADQAKENKEKKDKGEEVSVSSKTAPETPDKIDFNAFILSSAFWPTLANESVDPPSQVESLMSDYNDLFKQSKGMRSLEWLNNLGSVEVEVELDEGVTKNFNVTPAQATLLVKFQEKDDWTLNDLATSLNINKSSLRNRIAFWIGQGVIIEKSNDHFTSAQTFQSSQLNNSIYESDDECGATSAQNQKDQELQVYWSYVVGMLTNIGSLPLDRIHAMLKMFASTEASTQCTLDDVKSFLQAKVNNGELVYVGGVYKLPKAN